jgi:hypothetical protein
MGILSTFFINGDYIMMKLAILIDHMLNIIIDFLELLLIGIEVSLDLFFRDCFSL